MQKCEKHSMGSKPKPYFQPYKRNASFMTLKSQSDHSELFKIMLIEINETNDYRTGKFDEAEQEEIAGLLERKTWNLILRSEVPEDSKILRAGFILANKDKAANNELC